MPVDESLERAADLVYGQDDIPDYSKATFKSLLNLAVQNVNIKCASTWYKQVDGLARGSKLSVDLSNIWLRQFEPVISGHGDVVCNWTTNALTSATNQSEGNDGKHLCGKCGRSVTNRVYSPKCKKCNMWYHGLCTDRFVGEVKRVVPELWSCGCVCITQPAKIFRCNSISSPAKLFPHYVDDILRTAKQEEIQSLLENPNQLHTNVEFTIEKEDHQLISRHYMAKLSSAWYSKPTDTNNTVNYHSCAPTRYKRNKVKGAVHRIHHTTSSWSALREGIELLHNCPQANQYPPNFTLPKIREAITNIMEKHDQGRINTRTKTMIGAKEICLLRSTEAVSLMNTVAEI